MLMMSPPRCQTCGLPCMMLMDTACRTIGRCRCAHATAEDMRPTAGPVIDGDIGPLGLLWLVLPAATPRLIERGPCTLSACGATPCLSVPAVDTTERFFFGGTGTLAPSGGAKKRSGKSAECSVVPNGRVQHIDQTDAGIIHYPRPNPPGGEWGDIFSSSSLPCSPGIGLPFSGVNVARALVR